MNFNPVDRKPQKLLPKGEYEFVVLDAEETQSAAGNDMIVLTLEVSNGNDTSRVRDYLVAKRAAKLRKAVQACGFGDRYHTGSVKASEFIDRAGRVRLGIEKGGDEYPDKNVVVDYLASAVKAKMLPAPSIDKIIARYGK